MTIAATNSAAAVSAAAPPATSSTANGTDSTGVLNFTQNFNTFLTLLTTQLKNQDPLNPTDSSQFTNQLVSFSEVEQQIKTNSELSTEITALNSSEAISAVPMIGRTIEYTGNQAALQNGQAAFSYTLPTAAAAANIVIKDANGATVAQLPANTAAGQHSFVWNGQNSAGQQQPNGGLYTMQVLASDANNSPITATTTATGTVTSVSVANNVATFNVSGVSVPMSQLVNVVNSTSTASN
ncbi:MAG TPA: flagellar hook capping FlgD N-terminal domain-containing protein [Stellaceae bacterium]|nr:flagellar hook capping FlgD N-terminal domain-containing protein [Stellaceae bacterium]